ncbi:MAG: excisionase family DNA-binding protein [Chloroflexota bacterium]
MNENLAYYTVLEACERLRCSRRYLYELLARDELASFTMGRARRIVAASIDAYVERRLEAARQPNGEVV